MNRSLKLVALLIVLASFALSIAALAWRWREAGDVAAVFAGPKPFRPMIILALPAVLAGLLAFTDLGLARQEPRITREGRWFVSFTLLTHVVLLVAIQAWMVATYLGPVGPDHHQQNARRSLGMQGISVLAHDVGVWDQLLAGLGDEGHVGQENIAEANLLQDGVGDRRRTRFALSVGVDGQRDLAAGVEDRRRFV